MYVTITTVILIVVHVLELHTYHWQQQEHKRTTTPATTEMNGKSNRSHTNCTHPTTTAATTAFTKNTTTCCTSTSAHTLPPIRLLTIHIICTITWQPHNKFQSIFQGPSRSPRTKLDPAASQTHKCSHHLGTDRRSTACFCWCLF